MTERHGQELGYNITYLGNNFISERRVTWEGKEVSIGNNHGSIRCEGAVVSESHNVLRT